MRVVHDVMNPLHSWLNKNSHLATAWVRSVPKDGTALPFSGAESERFDDRGPWLRSPAISIQPAHFRAFGRIGHARSRVGRNSGHGRRGAGAELHTHPRAERPGGEEDPRLPRGRGRGHVHHRRPGRRRLRGDQPRRRRSRLAARGLRRVGRHDRLPGGRHHQAQGRARRHRVEPHDRRPDRPRARRHRHRQRDADQGQQHHPASPALPRRRRAGHPDRHVRRPGRA